MTLDHAAQAAYQQETQRRVNDPNSASHMVFYGEPNLERDLYVRAFRHGAQWQKCQDTLMVECPVCGAHIEQVASATLSLALWQHFNWMHKEFVKGLEPLKPIDRIEPAATDQG